MEILPLPANNSKSYLIKSFKEYFDLTKKERNLQKDSEY